ncbi:MAG: type II toxin-antitoxin system prevent-host-death family antitoxin [Thermoleophilaceae bacterium]|nr:type II toxin-antitoxin system prevent-host-death family antitoxin [Thermoleophilaceae bacterium]
MATVGIRELRQNLSVYLRRVERGESLRVTDRGREVALLGPLPEHQDVLSRLEAEGKLRRATRSLSELGPPLEHKGEMSVSEALEEQREDSI